MKGIRNMNKQEFEDKYRIFKEVEAFFQSIGKETKDEQISIQFSSLSEAAQVKVLELTANESERRRNG